jgi:REP element-mobilizing transposase RayT
MSLCAAPTHPAATFAPRLRRCAPRGAWPDLPPHHFTPNGTFVLTGATHEQARLFDTTDKLDLFLGTFLELASDCRLVLHAWAFLDNHYHAVASFERAAVPRCVFLRRWHREISARLNVWDRTAGRRVMEECWDTELTFEGAWLDALHYVHLDPVHHGFAPLATDYAWCSAGWFETHATFSFVRSVYARKPERVPVPDDFRSHPRARP